jgi:hypothetical protein
VTYSEPKNHAQPKTAPGWCRILQHAIIPGRAKGDISKVPDLREVYKNGWLQAELDQEGELIYIVPTHIPMCVYQSLVFQLLTILTVEDRYYTSILRSPKQNFPTDKFASLNTFWREVVRVFSQSALATDVHSIATGGRCRPREAQWSDEVYRSPSAPKVSPSPLPPTGSGTSSWPT